MAQQEKKYKSRKAAERTMDLLALLIVILMSVAVMIPIWWIFRSSLMTNAQLFQWPPKFFPPDWLWSNYKEALKYFPFLTYLKNTMKIIIPSVIGGTVTATLGGYAFARLRFKGKKISQVDLVTTLVALWFVTFLIILIIRFFDYSRERAMNKKKQEELKKNLRALEIEKSEYEKSSKEDPLTGCLNRAGFSGVLLREQEKLNRTGIPVSFMIFDIDHFKDVNDTYGHLVGDEVLVNLAKLVQSMIRNTDSLVRWGGEEFVILSDETSIQNAAFLAEKLRKAIETTTLITQQQVTCSFGVTEIVPGEDPKSFIARADKALYSSKEGGRNRVTVATFRRSH